MKKEIMWRCCLFIVWLLMSGEADFSHGTIKFRATWIPRWGERGHMKGEEMKDRQEEGKWKITLWPNSKPKAKQAARTNFLFWIITSGGDFIFWSFTTTHLNVDAIHLQYALNWKPDDFSVILNVCVIKWERLHLNIGNHHRRQSLKAALTVLLI